MHGSASSVDCYVFRACMISPALVSFSSEAVGEGKALVVIESRILAMYSTLDGDQSSNHCSSTERFPFANTFTELTRCCTSESTTFSNLAFASMILSSPHLYPQLAIIQPRTTPPSLFISSLIENPEKSISSSLRRKISGLR